MLNNFTKKIAVFILSALSAGLLSATTGTPVRPTVVRPDTPPAPHKKHPEDDGGISYIEAIYNRIALNNNDIRMANHYFTTGDYASARQFISNAYQASGELERTVEAEIEEARAKENLSANEDQLVVFADIALEPLKAQIAQINRIFSEKFPDEEY